MVGQTSGHPPNRAFIEIVLSKGFELLNAITRGADVEEPPVFSLSQLVGKKRGKRRKQTVWKKISDLPSGPGKVLL